MKKSTTIYSTNIIGDGATSRKELVERWTTASQDLVKSALISGADLPTVFPPIKVEFAGRPIALEDLRGLNLRGIRIEKYDLAYCALDFSILDNCTFEGTRLQYSRLFSTSLKNARLIDVQASPVDARLADLMDSTLIRCFITNSDLGGVNSLRATVEECDFTESSDPIVGSNASNLPSLKYNSTSQTVIRDHSARFKEAIDRIMRHEAPASKKQASRLGKVVFLRSANKIAVNVGKSTNYKSAGLANNRKTLYIVKAAAQDFSLGDFVEIVKFETRDREPNRASQFRSHSGKSSNATLKARKPKQEWMISRVVEDSGDVS